jgi:hypothetical protein
MTTKRGPEMERRIEQLAAERIALFARASADANTSALARDRLKAIERELDECFLAVRSQRAERDAKRFVAEEPAFRTRVARPTE